MVERIWKGIDEDSVEVGIDYKGLQIASGLRHTHRYGVLHN